MLHIIHCYVISGDWDLIGLYSLVCLPCVIGKLMTTVGKVAVLAKTPE